MLSEINELEAGFALRTLNMSRWNLGWILGLLGISLLGISLTHSAPSRESNLGKKHENIKLLVDVLEEVQGKYVKELDAEKMRELVENMITSGLERLDPHSSFINPDEYKQFMKQSKGKFGGVGIRIGLDKNNQIFVESPMVGTPAYEAGVMAGDERDAVRKMKLGQLQGAALTATGIGLIQPQVRVFEAPFMWKDVTEMDGVRAALDGDIRRLMEEKGYVLLNWGDVGPVHLFTNIEVKSKDDLPKLKMWQWGDDPVVKGLFAAMGLKGVNLGVPDVLPSLQTGLIDACYGSPLSTLALQWNTKIKFMTRMAVSYAIGAQVITKATWDGLGPAVQKIVLEESKKLEEKTRQIVREQDNARALVKMQQLGLKVVDTPAPLLDEFMAKGRELTVKLDGQLYTKEFRQKVEKLRDDARAGKKL